MLAPLLPRDRALSYSHPFPPMVSASALSPSDKQRLWAYLKEHQPERAAFFSDPVVQALMGQGAVPAFRLADCEAAGLSIPSHLIDR